MNKIQENLKDQLKQLKVKDLKKLGYLFNLNNMNNKKKDILIEEIYNCLTNDKNLNVVISRMIDKEFNLLKRIIENKGIIEDNSITEEDYYYLISLKIITTYEENNNQYITIPKEIYNIIKNINLDNFNIIIKENTDIYYLLKALLEVYGVVSIEDLKDIYNNYYNPKEEYNLDITNNSFIFTNRIDRITQINLNKRNYYVNKILTTEYFEDILNNIINNHNKINRKLLIKEELLNYSNYSYYKETNTIKEFKHYLKDKVSSNKIDNIIINIINIFKLSPGNLEVALKMLEEYRIKELDRNIINNYLISIYNEIILWENNGWTINELNNK